MDMQKRHAEKIVRAARVCIMCVAVVCGCVCSVDAYSGVARIFD